MRIRSISFDDKKYELSDSSVSSEENTFTVLVGRNGSGKSRILQRICNIYINSLGIDGRHILNTPINLNAYNDINNTSSLNYGKITYEQNKNTYEISSRQLNGLYNFHISQFIIEKKSKPLNAIFSVILTKLLLFQPAHLISFQLLKDICIGIVTFMKKIYL